MGRIWIVESAGCFAVCHSWPQVLEALVMMPAHWRHVVLIREPAAAEWVSFEGKWALGLAGQWQGEWPKPLPDPELPEEEPGPNCGGV